MNIESIVFCAFDCLSEGLVLSGITLSIHIRFLSSKFSAYLKKKKKKVPGERLQLVGTRGCGQQRNPAPSARPQVCEHLLPGLQHGQHVPLCVQQHRDCAHLQTRDCERKVSCKDTFVAQNTRPFSPAWMGTPAQTLPCLQSFLPVKALELVLQ